ncbi:MAG TPA: adaptor protein MecA [Candidatus Onthocola gallistercoris]|uniref:Adaptor protein MecA n=1 Tax=Candidatus Onthocola gallistercoris TaxID=2840876 RepID=A0A9D1HHX4_9FIRM|nr:adaptor protein MecA [Candidatus Onthocola gallistercoris]
MKIERLNENQIRCTLNKDDLTNREIKLSELAYGSDKARKLFRDMMTQASSEVGFEANDIPLVIEAIPVSSECIILIVTKIEDPDELDTRFAKFSPSSFSLDEEADETTDDDDRDEAVFRGADDILDLFRKISEELIVKEISDDESSMPLPDKKKAPEKAGPVDLTRTFSFRNLSDACRFCGIISSFYKSPSILYKHPTSGCYYLVLTKGKLSPELFNKVCNIAVEYSDCIPANAASLAYYAEHFPVIISRQAVQKLSSIGS